MKKRSLILGCLAVGSMMLTACAPQVTTSVPNVIQVQNVESSDGKITVSASETVEVVPDMAEVVLGITTEHEDATACQQENTETLDKVLEFLKNQGFEDDSIKTTGFSMNPRYDWSSNRQELVGYEMRTNITVTDVPIDQVGSLLSNVVDAGANEIDSVSYFSSQYDEAYDEALAKAVALAKEKAETLAHAGGCQVIDVLNIEEARDYQYGRYVDAGLNRSAKYALTEGASGAVADMSIMPGQMQITADIQVTFSLLPQ